MIEAAYNSVWLWAQAVSRPRPTNVADVIRAMRRQSLNAPEGIVTVDEETQHTWRPVYVGRIRSDGQFDLVWSSEKPIRPIPYPRRGRMRSGIRFLRICTEPGAAGLIPGTGGGAAGGDGDVPVVPLDGECPRVHSLSRPWLRPPDDRHAFDFTFVQV